MLDRNLRTNQNISYLKNIDINLAKELLKNVKSYGVYGKPKRYSNKITNMLKEIEPLSRKNKYLSNNNNLYEKILPRNVRRGIEELQKGQKQKQNENKNLYLTPSVRSSNEYYEYSGYPPVYEELK